MGGSPPLRGRRIATLLACGCCALAGSATLAVATARAAPDWAVGLRPTLPANAASSPSAHLESVSCAAVGDCSAVGYYSTSTASGHEEGLLLNEVDGVWGAGQEAQLPADASSAPSVSVAAVSCSAPGDCSAVGYYDDASGHRQGLLLDETGGVWGVGQTLRVPTGANLVPSPSLFDVSCATPGNCTANGVYLDTTSYRQGLAVTETAGVWSQAVRLPPPPGTSAANPNMTLGSVSCSAPGDCDVVGSYMDNLNHNRGLLLTETDGSWTSTTPVLPSGYGTDPNTLVDGVSCTSPGNCSAVGRYEDSAGQSQGLLLTQTSGNWTQGVKATLPTGASPNPAADFVTISCTAPGYCTAGGTYVNGTATVQGAMVTESAGNWGTGVEIVLADAAATMAPQSVSCASPGECSAVGYAADAGSEQAVTLAQTGGTWAEAVDARLPGGQTSSKSTLASVSCLTADACVAVGEFKDATGTFQPLILPVYANPAPALTPPPSGPAGAAPGPAGGVSPAGPLTVAGATAHIGRVSVKGSRVRVAVSCAGPSSARCVVSLALTAREKLLRGRIVAVGATRRHHRAKRGSRTVTLATGGITLAGGRTATVTLVLGHSGGALLARFHRLVVRLVATQQGHRIASRRVTLKAKPRHRARRRRRS